MKKRFLARLIGSPFLTLFSDNGSHRRQTAMVCPGLRLDLPHERSPSLVYTPWIVYR
jgi:hypothetical protein